MLNGCIYPDLRAVVESSVVEQKSLYLKVFLINVIRVSANCTLLHMRNEDRATFDAKYRENMISRLRVSEKDKLG